MKRNKSLIISIAAGVLIIGGCLRSNSSGSPVSSITPSTSGTSTSTVALLPATATATATTAAVSDSGLTQQVTQGPYYVTGTNKLTDGNLNYDNQKGKKIKVQGYVYVGATGTTPVAGAKIEIWHADDSGNYHPNSNGAASGYKSSELSLRGYVLTDDKGYYEYTTIYPGEYTGRLAIFIPTQRQMVTKVS